MFTHIITVGSYNTCNIREGGSITQIKTIVAVIV